MREKKHGADRVIQLECCFQLQHTFDTELSVWRKHYSYLSIKCAKKTHATFDICHIVVKYFRCIEFLSFSFPLNDTRKMVSEIDVEHERVQRDLRQ